LLAAASNGDSVRGIIIFGSVLHARGGNGAASNFNGGGKREQRHRGRQNVK